MRFLLFILIICFVRAEEGPSKGCKNNPSTCKLADFQYDTKIKQCLYNNYDGSFSPWKEAVDGEFREECIFLYDCDVIPKDKMTVHYIREITKGNNRNEASTVKQEAVVYTTIPADVRAQAKKYYNRDLCQLQAKGYIMISVTSLIVFILLCVLIAFCYKKFKDAGQLEQLEEMKNFLDKTNYKHRTSRIF